MILKSLRLVLLLTPFLLNGGDARTTAATPPAEPEPAYFKTGVLTEADRVWTWTQIERVFHRHRLWPKENPGPKPPFEAMVPHALLAQRAREGLDKSAALETYWHRTLTPAMLQAEVARMAKGTQDPATLRELFAALRDDPRLIAQTLGRQTLADRLLRGHYAWDLELHAATRARANAIAARAEGADWKTLGGDYRRQVFLRGVDVEPGPELPGSTPGVITLKASEFDALKRQHAARTITERDRPGAGFLESAPDAGAPRLRPRERADRFTLERAAFVSDERIEIESISIPKVSFDDWWNGVGGSGALGIGDSSLSTNDRASFAYQLPAITTPAGCDEWTSPIGLNNILPAGRFGHTAVWTGTEMIVWGGNAASPVIDSGGRYNPATDTWAPVSRGANAPLNRVYHAVVWTGREMVIWGGEDSAVSYSVNTGGRYDPSTNQWRATSTGPNVPSPRKLGYGTQAVWTGSQMVVWGGSDNSGYLITGGRYDPVNDSWLPTSTGTNVPSARIGPAIVWTGSEMIVWGGFLWSYPENEYYNDGARYNPITDSWLPTSMGNNVPMARGGGLTGIWTGTDMIVWGGVRCTWSGSTCIWSYFNSGGRYSPVTDTWQPTSTATFVPSARSGHVVVWSGNEMIVWGGSGSLGSLNDGGRYSPYTDTWTPTAIDSHTPTPRQLASGVWTGTEMIVWGGSCCYQNTGGRYNPALDSWSPTSLGGDVPEARYTHTAIWTGAEMIVWGGSGNSGLFNSGGRYIAALDDWVPTPTGQGTPGARRDHTVIWTGSEMIVWGGTNGNPVATGGRYNPFVDTWIATSVGSSTPVERAWHSAVWSGQEMIIWGGSDYSKVLNSGGKYNPFNDAWIPTSIDANTPTARVANAVAWSGRSMYVWGGAGSSRSNTGGEYDPDTDSWSSLALDEDTPAPRVGPLAIWTGAEFIVWGGFDGSESLNSGGRYDPVQGRWKRLPAGASAPSGRSLHTDLWSGKEMIIWGGHDSVAQGLDSGGRYDPEADRWLSTSTGANLPERRYEHTAIWTGDRMIVWGGGVTLITPETVKYEYVNSGGAYASGAVSSPGNSLRAGKLSSIRLNWGIVPGAGSYNVKRCTASTTGCIPGTIVSSPTLNQYSEPDDSLSHFYAVEAVNQCGSTP